MARKRAPGGGRKPRGEAPAVHFNTRIAPEIRRRLERDAERNKRSLSREIELRLAELVCGRAAARPPHQGVLLPPRPARAGRPNRRADRG